jgi:NitT/TauT family transport system substrate-binding protein
MRRSRVLAVCGATLLAGRQVAGAQVLAPVRLGAVFNDDFCTALYAGSAGLFRRAGLDVQTTTLTSGAATAAAILGGALDIAISNMFALSTTHERGLPLTIASLGSVYNTKAPTVLMVVARDSPIVTVRDLAGKTVASSSLRDLNMITAMAWTAQNGGDTTTMRQVELPFASQLAAIDAGRIDAAILVAPFSQEAAANPKYRVIAHPYDSVAPSFVNGVYITTAQYAAANPEVIGRFSHAMREAAIYANSHHDQTAVLLAAASGIDLERIRHGNRATFFESLDLRKFQVLIDFLAKHQMLGRAFAAEELFPPAVIAAWR